MSETEIALTDLSHWKYGIFTKPAKSGEDERKEDKMIRLRNYFKENETRHSVRAIILLLQHGHPCVCLFKKGDTFKLPGGHLKVGEDNEEGLKRILDEKVKIVDGDYSIVDNVVATWYRPQFSDDHFLPYLPVHVKTAKEIEEWYVAELPAHGRWEIYLSGKDNKLVITKFYDLQGNAAQYGERLAVLPTLLSRFKLRPMESGK